MLSGMGRVALVVMMGLATLRESWASFDIEHDRFVLDGKPHQIISGSVHYYRIPHQYWKDRLSRLKHMGLNTIQFYTPWNAHEPRKGTFNFKGDLDLTKFIHTIKELGMHAIVRPGPYICAEWDFGGLPWWLASSKIEGGGTMGLRNNDPFFLKYVEEWWNVLLPKLKPHMHSEGGPILMAQIENEYGFCNNNKEYLRKLINIGRRNLGNSSLLFTTDPPWIIKRGSLQGDEIFSVVDFGPQKSDLVQVVAKSAFTIQKAMNPPGKTAPFCSEFYTGWLTHWGQAMANTSAQEMTDSFTKILQYANGTGSVNLYMAHGGTNFGFWAGAGLNGDEFLPQITSYDYGAPLSEQGRRGQPGIGGPSKFDMLKNAIEKETKRKPLSSWPKDIPTADYGSIELKSQITLLDAVDYLYPGDGIAAERPLNIEEYDQGHGAILYVTKLASNSLENGATLDLGGAVHDFAHIFLNRELIATVERSKPKNISLPKLPGQDNYLHILVHAMGRDSGGCAFDFKGLVNPVRLDGVSPTNWRTFPLPFTNLDIIVWNNVRQLERRSSGPPTIFRGELHIDKNEQGENGHPHDTFLNLTAWGKGLAFINGFNLGWYWPSIGPQNHYYVPGPRLKHGANEVILIEFEAIPKTPSVSFVPEPDLRGPPGGLAPRDAKVGGRGFQAFHSDLGKQIFKELTTVMQS